MLAWPQWLEIASVAKEAIVVNALNSTARGVVVLSSSIVVSRRARITRWMPEETPSPIRAAAR